MTDASRPAPRRLKTYTGSQGYVYQYYFVGKRPALPDEPSAPATEFIFDVTSDRKTTFAVSVFVPEQSKQDWSAAHGRALSDSEQYAAAKLRLFAAFDEFENMKADGRRLLVTSGSARRPACVTRPRCLTGCGSVSTLGPPIQHLVIRVTCTCDSPNCLFPGAPGTL
jgi:hypothetical protein